MERVCASPDHAVKVSMTRPVGVESSPVDWAWGRQGPAMNWAMALVTDPAAFAVPFGAERFRAISPVFFLGARLLHLSRSLLEMLSFRQRMLLRLADRLVVSSDWIGRDPQPDARASHTLSKQ